MSDRYYTCDICIAVGNDEGACHKPTELIQAGANVVCHGCLECGEFPELEDLPQTPFIPPEDKRIAALGKACASYVKLVGLPGNCGLKIYIAAQDEVIKSFSEAGYPLKEKEK